MDTLYVFKGLGIDLKKSGLTIKPDLLIGCRNQSELEFLENLALNTGLTFSSCEKNVILGIEPVFLWEAEALSMEDEDYGLLSSYSDAKKFIIKELVGRVVFRESGKETTKDELYDLVENMQAALVDDGLPFD